ncbi:hypothetical protein ACHAXN_006073 [Cyclotella atomus]
MSSDYESSSASPSSESEEEEWDSTAMKKPSRARRAKCATPPTRRNPRRYTTEEMNREIAAMRENASESSEEEVVRKPRRRAPPRNRRNLKESDSEELEDSDGSNEEPPTRPSRDTPSRPTRKCAADTKMKMSSAVKADRLSEKEALADAVEESEAEMLDSSDSESDEKPKAKKRKANDSDDEEYNEGLFNDDETSENDSEEEEEYASESDDGDRRSSRPKRSCAKKNSYKVNDDIGTADEESADEDAGPSILVSPSRKSTMAFGSPKLRQKARARRKPLAESSDEDSYKQTYFQHKQAQKESPTKLKTTTVDCPSEHDEITMMPLPKGKPHICFVTPDKQNRHCFTIETMYRIAISKASSDSNTSRLSNNGPLQFLQPPHFRTPISDDLLDQIACRFGREALVIEDSPLYKKLRKRSTGNFRGDVDLDDEMDEFDSDGEFVGGRGTGQNFDERFQRYVQSFMGSQDVYCCPLCYNEAYRRYGNQGDEEMIEDDASDSDGENEVKEDRFDFLDDPMTILGSADNHRFVIASTFCFKLLVGVKNHLRSVHHVDLTAIQGNDLFKRFQIRASDGLLQRWLRKSLKQRMAQPMHLQGDMMSYWLGGENQSFLLLLDQIERGELEGHQSGDYGSEFSESFPNRARRIWLEVSSPYLKAQDDMKEFLASESEEDEAQHDSVPINPHFTPPNKEGDQFKSPEDEMLEFLKRKNSQRGAASSSENDDSSSSDSSEELEVLSKQGIEEEEEEEEDEWTRSKSLVVAKRKAKRRGKRNNDDSTDDELFESNNANASTPNGNANTFGAEDSDNADEQKPSPCKSARKRVAESSDDES